MFCGHKTCQTHSNCKGVGAVLILKNYKKGIKLKNVVLLGRECGGQNAGQHSLPGGKVDAQDKGCLIKSIRREIEEEFKMSIDTRSTFDNLFRCSSGIRCFEMGRTLIFVGILPEGFSRGPIKSQMLHDNATHPNHAYREMDNIDWFRTDNFKQIENKSKNASKYACGAIAYIMTNNVNMMV
jgi:hypothetical protein